MTTSYQQFLNHRRLATQAIGRAIVERAETDSHCRDLIVGPDQIVRGLDVTPLGAVMLSRVSAVRRGAAATWLREAGYR
jgi:hypothetical protein